MKYLFVGDVHNHKYMFDDIKSLDADYNFNRIIFMGDYVDDWFTDNTQSLDTLMTVFKFKDSNPDKYTLLLGNHELSYLGYPCSGHKYELEHEVNKILLDDINNLDLYTLVDCGGTEYVCTHGGITNIFADEFLGENWKDRLYELNVNKLDNLNVLSRCSYFRGGNYSYSSFLWSDKKENQLYNQDIPKIRHQIVGHTPVPTIQLVEDIFYTDTHSTYQDGSKYGDRTYLIWDDRGFIVENSLING